MDCSVYLSARSTCWCTGYWSVVQPGERWGGALGVALLGVALVYLEQLNVLGALSVLGVFGNLGVIGDHLAVNLEYHTMYLKRLWSIWNTRRTRSARSTAEP